MSQTTIQQVVEQLQSLPEQQQQQVLAYARGLRAEVPAGVAGTSLLQFAGLIPQDDLEAMEQAIEQGCEQVDIDEW